MSFISKGVQETFRAGAPAKTIQTSACVILVLVGTELQHEIYFPAPVIQPCAKLKLARQSLYIEVVVPIACPEKQEYLQDLMYPIFLDKSSSVNRNLPSLNLDRLPILDPSKTADLQWLITHTSFMLSIRERGLRKKSLEIANGIHTNVRLDYKISLWTLFIRFSGLHGERSRIFCLADATGRGERILIIVSQLRLDLANSTVTLDAAVLPLTKALVSRTRSFLEAIKTEVYPLNVTGDDMRSWKQTLPAFVERCRDWTHTSSCEYLINSRIPLSVEKNEAFLYSCGKGKFPNGKRFQNTPLASASRLPSAYHM